MTPVVNFFEVTGSCKLTCNIAMRVVWRLEHFRRPRLGELISPQIHFILKGRCFVTWSGGGGSLLEGERERKESSLTPFSSYSRYVVQLLQNFCVQNHSEHEWQSTFSSKRTWGSEQNIRRWDEHVLLAIIELHRVSKKLCIFVSFRTSSNFHQF